MDASTVGDDPLAEVQTPREHPSNFTQQHCTSSAELSDAGVAHGKPSRSTESERAPQPERSCSSFISWQPDLWLGGLARSLVGCDAEEGGRRDRARRAACAGRVRPVPEPHRPGLPGAGRRRRPGAGAAAPAARQRRGDGRGHGCGARARGGGGGDLGERRGGGRAAEGPGGAAGRRRRRQEVRVQPGRRAARPRAQFRRRPRRAADVRGRHEHNAVQAVPPVRPLLRMPRAVRGVVAPERLRRRQQP